eukprot:TRINITY_DN3867_c0_g1_i1.p1 TRINITY_DN3867_c0_g1~~TRINITY_DN3867_c0_g1_i1.p1  ORF type:complete len:555 (-),score=119.42 TRINITY_DN3867_c0_g1_i1:79-1713(-)
MSEPSEGVKLQEPRIRDFVAVGAGPHSLAVVSRLLETKSRFYTDHDLTTKRKYYQEVDEETKPLDVVVVDPAGSWLARWHSAFDQMKIKFLRSPVTAHPDPFEDTSLLSFASSQKRESELLPIDNLFFRTGNETKTSKSRQTEHRSRKAKQKESFNQVDEKFFRRPSTPLFRQFCDELIERYNLKDIVYKASVTKLEPIFDDAVASQDSDDESEDSSESGSETDSDDDDHYVRQPRLKKKPSHFRLYLSDGTEILTKRVLLATGLTLSNVPDWAEAALAEAGSALPARICHSDNLWITGASAPALYDRRVLVVGSGLSSCHLALTATSYNASKVLLVARKQLQAKQFDIDLNWMGRFKQYQLSKFWQTTNWKKRLQMIRQARGGGSVAPDILQDVRDFSEQNPERLEVWENAEVACIESLPHPTEPSRHVWKVQFKNSDRVEEVDYIWLATGRKRDACSEPLFKDLYEHFPIHVEGGLPAVDIDLRWRSGVEVYVTGAYASLQVGPEALNLAGAKAASERIYTGIVGGVGGDENIFSILGDSND